MCSVRKLILLLTVALAVLASTIASDVEPSFCKGKKGFCVVRRSSSTSPNVDDKIEKRGIPARPGDIEVFGYYGSLLAIPTLLSVMGIVTNYNLEKSYFNSQINAQYYKQSREMLKAHAAQLIREQEQKFAKAGVTWQGMTYDKNGNANPGAKLPSSKGVVLLPPEKEEGQEQAPKTPQQADPSAPSTSPNASSPAPEGQGSSGAEESNGSSPTTGGAEEPSGSANSANVSAGQGGSSNEGTGAAGGSTAAGSTGAATGGDGAKGESS
ncbi:uncharacterized protein PAN0_003d1725 [Moesziomyces antarcticus]|nr:uncharacterized protein PAN0_003d1725 [Moesziomyces antarcticus]GAK63520.1 hypothetical protein PAN0_003d1725 [Moesziomyces antarcticus]